MTGNTPISDEAVGAFMLARFGDDLPGDEPGAEDFEANRAGLAAAAPLLVSAEAERDRDEAQMEYADALRTIEGLRAELAERDREISALLALADAHTEAANDRARAALRAAGGQEKWRDEPKCHRCGGTGGVPFDGDMVECHSCEGTGVGSAPAAGVGGLSAEGGQG